MASSCLTKGFQSLLPRNLNPLPQTIPKSTISSHQYFRWLLCDWLIQVVQGNLYNSLCAYAITPIKMVFSSLSLRIWNWVLHYKGWWVALSAMCFCWKQVKTLLSGGKFESNPWKKHCLELTSSLSEANFKIKICYISSGGESNKWKNGHIAAVPML